jgi:hypothetical protein
VRDRLFIDDSQTPSGGDGALVATRGDKVLSIGGRTVYTNYGLGLNPFLFNGTTNIAGDLNIERGSLGIFDGSERICAGSGASLLVGQADGKMASDGLVAFNGPVTRVGLKISNL